MDLRSTPGPAGRRGGGRGRLREEDSLEVAGAHGWGWGGVEGGFGGGRGEERKEEEKEAVS